MLALARSSEAEIVYIPVNEYIGTYNLDLTGDGTTDFQFTTSYRNQSFWRSGHLSAFPAQSGNGIMSSADPIPPGVSIGPNGEFGPGGRMASATYVFNSPFTSLCRGAWGDIHHHFLGLKFMISGEVHYGWARLSVTCRRGTVETLLISYAYETIPNKGIKTGKKKGKLEDESLIEPDQPTPPTTPVSAPATLGMLAKGVEALSIWRRE
jgi:hypothetical protein